MPKLNVRHDKWTAQVEIEVPELLDERLILNTPHLKYLVKLPGQSFLADRWPIYLGNGLWSLTDEIKTTEPFTVTQVTTFVARDGLYKDMLDKHRNIKRFNLPGHDKLRMMYPGITDDLIWSLGQCSKSGRT